MNKRIRSLIDDLFADMKMTAENLALRDELMANAQARYEDAVAQGRSEEEAFADVAASLGDVRSLLRPRQASRPKLRRRPMPGMAPGRTRRTGRHRMARRTHRLTRPPARAAMPLTWATRSTASSTLWAISGAA